MSFSRALKEFSWASMSMPDIARSLLSRRDASINENDISALTSLQFRSCQILALCILRRQLDADVLAYANGEAAPATDVLCQLFAFAFRAPDALARSVVVESTMNEGDDGAEAVLVVS